nr:hypothetical protein [Mangrovicoccus sp. HB161399]
MSAPVQFGPGASGAALSGTISGHEYMDYVLGARAGQHMSGTIRAEATNGDGSVYFNILPPGSDDVAIFVGAADEDGNAAEVALPETGEYVLRVYLMGNDRDAGRTVGYVLEVSIR